MFKFLISFFICFNCFSQKNLEQLLKIHNTESIPYISVNDLKKENENIILLDTREFKEYKISHIQNALFVGYDNFNLKKTLKNLPKEKNAKIIVYCSLGIRSEDIGEQLKDSGYTNVLNLYGGIFEWKNNDNNVFTSEEKVTEKVHTFNKEWSKWLLKGEKIYE
jgi:rhodanese-related sulfurtransferase